MLRRIRLKTKLRTNPMFAKKYYGDLVQLRKGLPRNLPWESFQNEVIPLAKRYNVKPKHILRDMHYHTEIVLKWTELCEFDKVSA